MKKLFLLLLAVLLLPAFPAAADGEAVIEVEAPSAVLIEASTGSLIYEKDAHTRRSPASVTKIMTMLLIAEAVDSGRLSLDEPVTASARAAGMGGSQIWLEEGETMSLGEMLKCVAVVSANDCCVALAEHLSGSEEAFVALMNSRAQEMGLENTHFVCCSGLSDDDEHYSSAYDLAMIARQLLRHDFIREYTGIWMDTIRNGRFTLTNTNKLVYHYEGTTGLKTGFTSKAMHCLAASAMRDGVEYIAVVLGCESSAQRFESAKSLLSYAFANFSLVSPESLTALPPVKVNMGFADCVGLEPVGGSILLPKNISGLSCRTQLPDRLEAPVKKGSCLGTLEIYRGDELLASVELLAAQDCERLGLWDIFLRLFGNILGAIST